MIPEKIEVDNSEAFVRLPSGTTWEDLTKIVKAKGNYSGLIIYVDNEIYKLLPK